MKIVLEGSGMWVRFELFVMLNSKVLVVLRILTKGAPGYLTSFGTSLLILMLGAWRSGVSDERL